MSPSCLILTPKDAAAEPPPVDAVEAALRDVGLISTPLAEPGRFRVGERFLQLLAFLGCSPVVELDADGPNGCQVQLRPAGALPEWAGGSNAAVPRCPGCRQRIDDWRDRLPGWRAEPLAPWSCPGCGRQTAPWALDWRQQGGFGRLFVEVWGIYPGEAVPGDELLEALRGAGGGAWRHFYHLV